MAVAAGTKLTFGSVEDREDLSDVAYEVAPNQTPFISNIGKGRATGTFHEWTDVSLNAATDDNANLEGDEATNDAPTPRTRPGNYTQIADKVAQVSGTQEVVEAAGYSATMADEQMHKTVELRTDIEKQLLSNKPSIAGNATTARQSASFECFITTNASRGTGGANGGFSSGIVSAPTDGTQRAFTETFLKDVMDSCFNNGAKPSLLFLGTFNKRAFSSFTGIADIRRDANGRSQAQIVGAADQYLSDHGWLTAIPSQFIRARTADLVDPDLVSMDTLPERNFMSESLAKSGDYERRQIITEYTLRVTEKGCGSINDLTTS